MNINLPFTLTPEQMQENFKTLMDRIQVMFESRSDGLLKMYRDLETEVMMAPASSREHFHNAFPGGYLDHILRVFEYSFKVYEMWKSCNIPLDFTPEELAFVAIHHDLGKVGLPEENMGRYVWNTSEWHRKNQGKIYETNPNVPFMLVQDMSLFVLQKYNIPLTMNETLGIKLHDGLYEEGNRPYYLSRSQSSALRTYLPMIVHQADLMASKFEYERWCKASGNIHKKYKG
jgi:hypothetical protein